MLLISGNDVNGFFTCRRERGSQTSLVRLAGWSCEITRIGCCSFCSTIRCRTWMASQCIRKTGTWPSFSTDQQRSTTCDMDCGRYPQLIFFYTQIKIKEEVELCQLLQSSVHCGTGSIVWARSSSDPINSAFHPAKLCGPEKHCLHDFFF